MKKTYSKYNENETPKKSTEYTECKPETSHTTRKGK